MWQKYSNVKEANSYARRLTMELRDLARDPLPLCYVEPDPEILLRWNAVILGPPESPYKGAAIFLRIDIPQEYPFKCPQFYFLSKIFHPNVFHSGEIKMEYLIKGIYEDKVWRPTIRINQPSQISLLSNPYLGDPVNEEAGKMYEKNQEGYNLKAKNSCKNDFCLPERQHLYFKIWFWKFGNVRKKLLNQIDQIGPKADPNFKDIQLEDLCYPHDKLDEYFEIYKSNNATPFVPLSVIKSHGKAENLYLLIKAAETDYKKWIAFMMESGDIEFVENNVEFRICNDLKNEELWKLYFEFTKEHDTKRLLQLYSKYCRFFPDDINMMQEYKEVVEKHGPCFVPWNDPFDFETFDENALAEKQKL